jgi:hypothetical protein
LAGKWERRRKVDLKNRPRETKGEKEELRMAWPLLREHEGA